MNAKYYEYVNEKKKKIQRVAGVEPTTLNLLINCSTLNLWITSLPLYNLSHANHIHVSNC